MSATPTSAEPANRPGPPQDRPANNLAALSRFALVIGLLRKLIEYGKGLTAEVQQHVPGTRLPYGAQHYRTGDPALILAHIARGLLLATALKDWLLSRGVRPEARRAPGGTASSRPSRTAKPAARRPKDADAVFRMPTPEEAAAEVRRRPAGAVLADICRDLAIAPEHPLWRDLQKAIRRNGGNAGALVKDMLDRAFDRESIERHVYAGRDVPQSVRDAVWVSPFVPRLAADSTGPP